jgi:hypothetical protein
MDDFKKLIVGTIITVVIGGTAYTINQEDLVQNFSEDTGVSQEQAQEYVSNINESDLLSFTDIGSNSIEVGEIIVKDSETIDCINYEYGWQSDTLPCPEGKMQLKQIGQDYIILGKSYIKLDLENSNIEDIKEAIPLTDKVNNNLNLTIVKSIMTPSKIDEEKKATSYNKSLLKAIVEGKK